MSCERGCCPSPAEHYKSLSYVDHGRGSYHTKDKILSMDRDAYARLRKNGLQPRSVNGAYDVERKAKTDAQVEWRPPNADGK